MSGGGRGQSRRGILKTGGAFLAGSLASPFIWRPDRAYAAWPNDKPVRLVVANTPGGPSDISARLIAPALQEALGGTFIVENKPGGGAILGMVHVAKSEPDGYTLLVATSAWSMNPSLYTPAPYHVDDVAAIAELASSPSVFVVQPSLGVNTMKDMVALAKKDQSKFNIGSPPIGSTLHLGAELLKYREGLKDVAIVIHQGGGQAIQALLSGVVQAGSSSLAPAHPHIQAGTLKGLVILGGERWHDLPNVPTAAEVGYPDFNFETRTGLFGPPKMPPEIVARLEKAALAALARPDVKDKYQKAGFAVRAKGAKEYTEIVRKDAELFADIIKKAGIKAKQ